MSLDGMRPLAKDKSPTFAGLFEVLTDLYTRQLDIAPDEYVRQHGEPAWIESQVQTFRWYCRFLNPSTMILDWGCQHGPDSALVRTWLGTDVQIHGCDFCEPTEFSVFREFSQVAYTKLSSRSALPYPDDTFDTVIASGVLEHVPSDLRSLQEIYRILKPGGQIIISFLPNWLSLEEFKRRHSATRNGAHERLYSRRWTMRLLLHSGLRPVTPVLYQTGAWQRQAEALLGVGRLSRCVAAAARVALPVHVIRASTLCVVAEKVEFMW